MKSYSSISGDSRGSDDRSLWDPHAPVKSIDYIGSFALITNNICGPAMMSLPKFVPRGGNPSHGGDDIVHLLLLMSCRGIFSRIYSERTR
jgi:hypothetical protein